MVDESNLNEGKQGAMFALVALLALDAMAWRPGVRDSRYAHAANNGHAARYARRSVIG
jgi:hypothetical protein